MIANTIATVTITLIMNFIIVFVNSNDIPITCRLSGTTLLTRNMFTSYPFFLFHYITFNRHRIFLYFLKSIQSPSISFVTPNHYVTIQQTTHYFLSSSSHVDLHILEKQKPPLILSLPRSIFTHNNTVDCSVHSYLRNKHCFVLL